MGLSSDDLANGAMRVLGHTSILGSDEENIPPPQTTVMKKAKPEQRHRSPSSPPPYDEADLAMAETDFPEGELIPPTSPPGPKITPPPTIRRGVNDPQASRKATIAELDDLPDDAFLLSSPRVSPRAATQRPPRIEASAARSTLGGPGPSSSAAATQVQAPKAVKVDVKHPWSKEVDQKLRQIFKLPKFRKHQKEAIDETLSGKDGELLEICRLLLCTEAFRSLRPHADRWRQESHLFVLVPGLQAVADGIADQLPAVCSTGATRGVTFVVSPLISLINDQTRHLLKLDIPAIAYTGDMSQADKNLAHEQLSRLEPFTRVVYVTPEMLTMGGHIKNILRGLLQRKRLARFVVDEAHCVSQVCDLELTVFLADLPFCLAHL